jgi:hypothetical protein
MPKATDDLYNQVYEWFGGIDIYGPLDFLESHGFKEHGGVISPPTPAHTVSRDEAVCIDFLFQEWDFDYRENSA